MIRGQILPSAAFVAAPGTATGTSGIINIENATGGAGADSLVGDLGANTLSGGDGNDAIIGAPGNDTLNGGNNNDVLAWSNGDSNDIIDGGLGTDVVQVNGSITGGDNFTVGGNGTRVTFARTNLVPFSLDIGTTENLVVNGAGGDDTETVNSLAGVADLTNVNLFGLNGNDTFNTGFASAVVVSINGGSHTSGDTLNLDAQGGPVSDSGTQVSKPGFNPINYTQIENLSITNIGDLTITGSGVDDQLVINATSANSGTYRLNAGPVIAFTGLTKLTFNSAAGADALTINNPAAGLFAPVGGIDYNGGGQAGDALNLLGGGAADLAQTYFVGTTTPPIGAGPGNTGDGLVRFTGSSNVDIRFTGLAPIIDTVLAASLTVNSTDAANNISVTNGVAPRLIVAVDAFEPIEFNNKTQLIVNAGDGIAGGDSADTVLLNFSNTPVGLTGITVNAEGGADTVNVQANSNVPVTINGGDGLDIINVGNNGTLGSPGLLTPVGGQVIVNGDLAGANLTVDGSGAAVAADYTITGTTVTRTIPAGFGGVTYSNLSTLLLTTGSGANVITVSSTSVPTTVNTNAGSDSVLVGSGANTLDNILGALTVNGGGNAGDTLTLNDTADTTANTYSVFNSQISRIGIPTLSYSGVATVNLLGGTNDDRVNVRSTASGVVYNLETNDGADSIVVADGGLLNDIDGQLNVSTGSGSDLLIMLDGNDSAADTYTISLVGSVTEITFGDGDAAVDVRYNVVGGPGQLERFSLASGQGNDVFVVNSTTATVANTVAGSGGTDQFTISGNNLTGDSKFSGDDGVDDFVLNVAGGLTGSRVTIEGNNTSLNPALRDQLRINDPVVGRALTFDKGDAATELSVLGFGTVLQTNTLENLIYAGTNATSSVRGSNGTDDITVAGRVGSAQVFFGGNPWDGPSEGAYSASLPGLAGPAGRDNPQTCCCWGCKLAPISPSTVTAEPMTKSISTGPMRLTCSIPQTLHSQSSVASLDLETVS